MSVLKIHTYPDEVLKRVASAIYDIDGSIQTLIDDMVNTMYAAPGIGLAAPQVGIGQRLIVVDVSSVEEKTPLLILINPEIIECHAKIDSEEGCLSVPNFISTIRRDAEILVKGTDREGNPFEIEASGILSRAIQHEMDHLNGTLFIDRLSPIKKEFFKKRYLRALKT